MTQPNPFNQNQNQNQSPNAPIDEFEIMRRRLKQRGAVTGKEQQRDISRQFAAMGNLPSGAALKVRQQAQEAQERATSGALQDVNILEAQTRRGERESEAGRLLQRDLATQQAETQLGLAREQRAGAFDIASLGAQTDLEKARLAGANAIELQNIQNEASFRERVLLEQGADVRFAKQLAENQRMFDIEQQLKKENSSIQQELARSGLDTQQQEFAINKSVTALNALDLLKDRGFDKGEMMNIMDALDLPFANQVGGMIDRMFAESQAIRQTEAERRAAQQTASLGFEDLP